jgi:hypothetical protein
LRCLSYGDKFETTKSYGASRRTMPVFRSVGSMQSASIRRERIQLVQRALVESWVVRVCAHRSSPPAEPLAPPERAARCFDRWRERGSSWKVPCGSHARALSWRCLPTSPPSRKVRGTLGGAAILAESAR